MYLGGRQKPDFIALLQYKTIEQGGSTTAKRSKYRPQVEFPGLTLTTSGEQIFIDKEEVYLGDSVKAQMTILSVEAYKGKLYVGQTFRFFEIPSKTLGTGEILEIINKDLEKDI